MKLFCFITLYLSLNSLSLRAEVTHIKDGKWGLEAFVFRIPKEENRGFFILDVPLKKKGDNILSYWKEKHHHLMINGGYFEQNFTPVGLCKIKGEYINKVKAKKLSGFVAINERGNLSLLTKKDKLKHYPTILQAGPYVIDPGGEIGIKTPSGYKAKRTLIGQNRDGSLVIIVCKEIRLFELAQAIKKHLPQLERLLNLDGGPSTALKSAKHEVLNPWPVRNYIVKKSSK